MLIFTLKRLLNGVVVFIVVTALIYALFNFRGGYAIAHGLLGQNATPDQINAKVEELGLDRPLYTQYLDWLLSLLTGDLGTSFATREPVSDMLGNRLAVTLSLLLASVILTVLFALLLGMGAAVLGGTVDRFFQVISVAIQAIPGYLLALFLVITFSLTLRLFPATGFIPIQTSLWGWITTITLPAVAIAAGNVIAVGQQLRGSVRDTLQLDYIRMLRARGVSERSILLRHTLRNAGAPALTILSLQIIGILSGAVIVERVFALPGLGQAVLLGGTAGDIPLVLGCVTYMVIVVIVVNLLVDLVNGLLTPKARLS
ncbi:ABC transporter permease [Microbacterium sp. AGC85]